MAIRAKVRFGTFSALLLFFATNATSSTRQSTVRIDIVPQMCDLIPANAIAYFQVASIREGTALLNELSLIMGGRSVSIPGADSTLMDPTRPFGVAFTLQDSLGSVWMFHPADSTLVGELEEAGVAVAKSGDYIAISEQSGSGQRGSVGWIGKSLLAGTFSARFKTEPIAGLIGGVVDSLTERVSMLVGSAAGKAASAADQSVQEDDRLALWFFHRLHSLDTFDLALHQSNEMIEVPFELRFKQGAESLLVSEKHVRELPEVMACLPQDYDLLFVGASAQSEFGRMASGFNEHPKGLEMLSKDERATLLKAKEVTDGETEGPFAMSASMSDQGLEMIQVTTVKDGAKYMAALKATVTGGLPKVWGFRAETLGDTTISGTVISSYLLRPVERSPDSLPEGSRSKTDNLAHRLFPVEVRVEMANQRNRVVLLVNAIPTRMKEMLERMEHPRAADVRLPSAWKTSSEHPLCLGIYADFGRLVPLLRAKGTQDGSPTKSALVSFFVTAGKRGYAGELSFDDDGAQEIVRALSAYSGVDSSVADPLAVGLDHYRKNQLSKALPYFELAASRSPEDPDVHAWFAETSRRLGFAGRDREEVEAALRINPQHGFAHEILGSIHQDASKDQWAAEEYLKAAECDPKNGSPWLSLWYLAIKAGDRGLERMAVQKIGQTGFFTPSAMAHARWMLQDAPKNSVLLANGDMDTYPVLILQEEQHVRSDVTLVNGSMLRATWYRDYLAKIYKLPMRTQYSTDVDSAGVTIREDIQQLTWWAKEGRLKRPLAISVSVPFTQLWPGAARELVLAGSVFRHDPQPAATMDTAAVGRSLRGIRISDFSSPMVGEQDRSSVRMATGNALKGNVTGVAVRYANALLEADRLEDAWAAAQFAREFELVAKSGVSHEGAFIGFTANLTNRFMRREKLQAGDSLLTRTMNWMEANGESNTVDYCLLELSLGSIKSERGNHEEAIRLFNRSLDAVMSQLGPTHYLVAGAMDGLGLAYQHSGDYQKAAEIQREAMALLEEVMPGESIITAACQNNLGYTLMLDEAYEEAEKILRQSLGAHRRLEGVEELMLAGVMDSLGDLLLRTGRAAEAESLLAGSLAIVEEEVGRESMRFAKAQSIMGSCLAQLGRYEEAEPLLLNAHRRLMAVLGEENEDTARTRDRLVSLYESWGKDEKAKSFKAAGDSHK